MKETERIRRTKYIVLCLFRVVFSLQFYFSLFFSLLSSWSFSKDVGVWSVTWNNFRGRNRYTKFTSEVLSRPLPVRERPVTEAPYGGGDGTWTCFCPLYPLLSNRDLEFDLNTRHTGFFYRKSRRRNSRIPETEDTHSLLPPLPGSRYPMESEVRGRDGTPDVKTWWPCTYAESHHEGVEPLSGRCMVRPLLPRAVCAEE